LKAVSTVTCQRWKVCALSLFSCVLLTGVTLTPPHETDHDLELGALVRRFNDWL
jgi:hypothetical protein